MNRYNTIEEYLNSIPEVPRDKLIKLREIISRAVPEAEEMISYGMPSFNYYGMLIWYGAFKNHYALFPKTEAMKKFKERLNRFDLGKGTIRIPIDTPVPEKLVTDIVKFVAKENLKNKKLKEKKSR